MSLLLLFKSGVAPPPGVATAEYAPSIPQLGESVLFTDTTTPVQASRTWSFGIGATPSSSTSLSPSVVFNTLGNRTVTMNVQPLNATWTQSINVVAVRPRLVNVEVGFQSLGNNSAPLMKDISPYVRSISIQRGRQHELDRVEAGTCTIRLDNSTRQFDPTNAASNFYYGGTGLLPMKRVSVYASKNGASYPLFSGFIEQWPRTREGVTQSEVEIVCVDGFVAFAAADLAVHDFPAQTTGERIAEALSVSDWGVAKQLIDKPPGGEGYSLALRLQTNPTDESLLDFIQEVSDTEIGRFFMDNRGNAVFHDANHRIRVSANRVSRGLPSVLGTFGDAGAIASQPAYLPYEDVVASYDASEIRNWIQVNDRGGVAHTIADATSRSNYLTRVYSRDTQLTAADAITQAAWLLTRYKAPSLRYTSMVLNPYDDARLWPYVLGAPTGVGNPDDYVDLGGSINVVEYPPGGGLPIVRTVYIESISHEISSDTQWETTWQLSPASTAGVIVSDQWTLGTSRLGTDTVLT